MITEVPYDYAPTIEVFPGGMHRFAATDDRGPAAPSGFAAESLRNNFKTLRLAGKNALSALARAGSWILGLVHTRQARKRLRLCDTLSLGEKRFLAVVQIDGDQFLLAGSSNSISMLAQLEAPKFSSVLRQHCPQDRDQA